MPVSELTARMSNRELAEWRAYFNLEPWGEERADYRAGIVAATVANLHRDVVLITGGRASRKEYEPQDFVPKIKPRKAAQQAAQQTWQEQLAIVRMLNIVHGGEDKTK